MHPNAIIFFLFFSGRKLISHAVYFVKLHQTMHPKCQNAIIFFVSFFFLGGGEENLFTCCRFCEISMKNCMFSFQFSFFFLLGESISNVVDFVKFKLKNIHLYAIIFFLFFLFFFGMDSISHAVDFVTLPEKCIQLSPFLSIFLLQIFLLLKFHEQHALICRQFLTIFVPFFLWVRGWGLFHMLVL